MESEFREDIEQCLNILREGGTILYPTDTVWGIGCDATNPAAVDAIYQLKNRSETKSMLVLVDSIEMLENYCQDVPEAAAQLLELSEKPVTLVLDGASGLARNLMAEDGSVGIRVSRDEFSRELCKAFGKPVVSTSANLSGETTPRTFSEISPLIVDKVDYTVGWRRNETASGTPSSIIKFSSDGSFKILRK